MSDSLVGFILAIFSAFFNGSFTSAFKIKSVSAVDLHPVWFTVYVAAGVFISSWAALPFLKHNSWATLEATAGTTFEFEPLGLIAGLLFVLSIAFSFAAIQKIGVALGQGLWGGCAILVSFLWGVIAFGDKVQSVPVAIVSLILLGIGVLGIAFCESLGNAYCGAGGHSSTSRSTDSLSDPLLLSTDGLREAEHQFSTAASSASINLESAQPSGGDLGPGAEDGSAGDRLVGFGCALGVGLCGGSTLVPLNYVTVRTKGLVFMPSFGCGAGISAVLYALGFVLLLKQRGQPIPPMHARETLLAGLVSGLWWNISNLLSIIAIPRVGFAIAGPLLQCALFVAGLLGIFVFKEIKGPAIPVFFAAGGVLIGGAGLLSYNSG